MKKVKVLLWSPDPKNFPNVSVPMKYTKRKGIFSQLRMGDYVDLNEMEAQTASPDYHAGRYKLVTSEDVYVI